MGVGQKFSTKKKDILGKLVLGHCVQDDKRAVEVVEVLDVVLLHVHHGVCETVVAEALSGLGLGGGLECLNEGLEAGEVVLDHVLLCCADEAVVHDLRCDVVVGDA